MSGFLICGEVCSVTPSWDVLDGMECFPCFRQCDFRKLHVSDIMKDVHLMHCRQFPEDEFSISISSIPFRNKCRQLLVYISR